MMQKSSYNEEHWTNERLASEIKKQKAIVGVLKVVSSNRRVAFISCSNILIDIIVDEQYRNRAIHGDVVAISLLEESEWIPIKGKILNDQKLKDSPNERSDVEEFSSLTYFNPYLLEDILNSSKSLDSKIISKKLQPKGKVVQIYAKKRKLSHVGTLVVPSNVLRGERLPYNINYVIFRPDDIRYPHLKVQLTDIPNEFLMNPWEAASNIYIADIVSEWLKTSKMGGADNLRSLGSVGTIEAETKALLFQNDIANLEFTDQMMEPLYSLLRSSNQNSKDTINYENWTIPEEEVHRRRDLRSLHVPVMTIDPSTAKDLDDAVHLEGPFEDGSFSIGVHIADVSYFLKEGSQLDVEAKRRATTVYLVQTVIPMLPAILSEKLCSLNPNVDRLAFSCIFKINADGSLQEDSTPWFGRTIIRTCAKLDYKTAQRMIDGEITEATAGNISNVSESVWETARRPIGFEPWEIVRTVCNMNKIASARRRLRLGKGSLILSSSKLSFCLDSQSGEPTSVSMYKTSTANELIEEFMLLANYFTAKTLVLTNQPCLLRHHLPPDEGTFGGVLALAEHLNLTINTSSAKSIQESLDAISESTSLDDKNLVSIAVMSLLRHPMKLAKYIVGTGDDAYYNHFALNMPYYTHFTSPIRRYADVQVHRLLARLTAVSGSGSVNDSVSSISDSSVSGSGSDSVVVNAEKTPKISSLQSVVHRCNKQQLNAKNAQSQSDELYFALYLQRQGSVVAEAVVVGVGEKSFTVVVPIYGVEYRLFVDEIIKYTAVTNNNNNNTATSGAATAAPVTTAFGVAVAAAITTTTAAAAVMSSDYDADRRVISLRIKRMPGYQLETVQIQLMSQIKVKLFASSENSLLKSKATLILN